jgi:hypothetical protein
MRRAALIRPCLALGLALAVLAPASAQVPSPQRKPGMWEMSLVNSTARDREIKSQLCTDASVEKRFSALGGSQGPVNCAQGPLRRTATGFEFESTCKAPGHTTVTKGVATGDFQKSYRIELTSHITPAPGGAPPVMTSIVQARWLGPCPAGRKPGDMVMSNGMVMNMLSVAGAPR